MDDSIAVVGWACRLPGAPSPRAYWELLRDGVDAVSAPPPGRAGAAPRGGFLDRVEEFDPAFFGISPREAVAMDPQQRLVLELSWEAFEEAGIVPATVRDSETGVFMGVMGDDYARLSLRSGAPPLSPHSATGLYRSLIANRVSYLFGLRGPSLTVDTGQSSSLVAVHLACESLRHGESTAALVGGVSLMLAEESAAVTATLGAFSPDGRCHAFDARANGFVRGEGAGVVLLKPLDRALADGDRVHCVIRGSAVNHGGASDGLTVPDRSAQEDVLRRAYARAGVEPGDVGYVEAHGTGTRVGDPVEADAIGAVLGRGAGAAVPLAIGSAKTNVGHLEGAAGIAGLLKVCLSIEHREIPPSLNFERPHPGIALDGLGLRVPVERGPWPEGPLVAGVSSFGVGGTNCHVVLAEAPARALRRRRPRRGTTPSVLPWPLSARGRDALRGQAEQLLAMAAGLPANAAADVGLSLATTRSAFEHRAVVLAADITGFRRGVGALAAGRPAPNVVQGVAAREPGRIAFVFPGQGSQWPDMAVDLLAASPVFAAELRRCDAALGRYVDWSLTDVLTGVEGAAPLDRVDVLQPALFAVMVSLTALWRSVGVRPDAVVGHSQGEIAAAYAAGALSLDEAARVVALRSRALLKLAGTGTMAAVPLPVEECRERLRRWDGLLDVAAVNGPSATVVSGEPRAVAELIADCEAAGVRARGIAVDYASHSAAVDCLSGELAEALAGITPRTSDVPFYSTVTGGRVDTATLDAAYWCRNLRGTVRFEEAVRALADHDHRVFVEVSPHPVLTVPLQDTFATLAGRPGADGHFAVGTLRRDEPGWERFTTSLCELHVRGVPVDWAGLFAGSGARRIALPTYAFQRRRYFLGLPGTAGPAAGADHAHDAPGPADGTDPADEAAPALVARLSGLPEAERYRAVLDVVVTHAALVAGHGDPMAVETGLTFKDLGFNSLTAAELGALLGAATGLRLPTTVAFDHPTPAALAEHLRALLPGTPETRMPTASVAHGTREATVPEPIAVVAMACRYPGGVTTPEDLWRLVEGEKDAIRGFPDDRGWDLAGLYHPEPGRSGTSYVREGGFVDDVAGFDAQFFGISPREALAMDPQQRLLLELSWELFERAGLDTAALRGSDTAVYAGMSGHDYGSLLTAGGVEGYLLTGGATSVMSGRIAYTFGLEGPALTVDTACSSSLVSMHLACQALRGGECSLALAGGATVMATPVMFQEFSWQRGLAADARCKPFSAAANGTSWAEGAGMVLLERLSDARRAGHPVLAVIRGSAVNQDGASNGLSAPNGQSQRRLIRQALANARLRPDEVDAVEAHGTGTELGDPIEAQALLAAYGQDRPAERPLLLGSMKSNIGHTQAASGVAGVIKTVMAFQHGLLPRTLHIDAPTPHVDWSAGAVSLLTESRPWPDTGRPRRAAVSAFGISGTNAHLVLEESDFADRGRRSTVPDDGDRAGAAPAPATGVPLPWVLSARGEAALRARAERVATHVARVPEITGADVATTLAATGTAFRRRAVVLGRDLAELTENARRFAAGEPTGEPGPTGTSGPVGAAGPAVIEGVAGAAGSTAFVLSGDTPLRSGVGRELHASFPVFARTFDEACACLDPALARSVRTAVLAEPGTPDHACLGRVEYAEPALFAVQVALSRLVGSLGLDPDYLMGDGVGELAAAHLAGVFSLHDGCRLAEARGRLSRDLAAGDATDPARAVQEKSAPLPEDREREIARASTNAPWSPGRTTGDANDAVKDFRRVAETLGYATATTPIVSGVTGEVAASPLDAGYWVEQAIRPGRLDDGIRRLRTRGVTSFVELGPDGTLTPSIRRTLDDIGGTGGRASVVATLHPDDAGPTRLLSALAEVYVRGGTVDWRRTVAQLGSGANSLSGRQIPLPTYPFQRRRFWPAPRTEES